MSLHAFGKGTMQDPGTQKRKTVLSYGWGMGITCNKPRSLRICYGGSLLYFHSGQLFLQLKELEKDLVSVEAF